YPRNGHDRSHRQTARCRLPALPPPKRDHPAGAGGTHARPPSNGLETRKRGIRHTAWRAHQRSSGARPGACDPPAQQDFRRSNRGLVLMARRAGRVPLNVYLNGRLVGCLRRESSGAIDFQYDKAWLDWENAIPVSVSLPLREDRYIGDPVLAVLENLL